MIAYEKIHQKITVVAEFLPGKKPQIKSFRWEDSNYLVTEVNLINKAKDGEVLVYLISVATAKGAYQLRLDTDTLIWWLELIYWEN